MEGAQAVCHQQDVVFLVHSLLSLVIVFCYYLLVFLYGGLLSCCLVVSVVCFADVYV